MTVLNEWKEFLNSIEGLDLVFSMLNIKLLNIEKAVSRLKVYERLIWVFVEVWEFNRFLKIFFMLNEFIVLNEFLKICII